MQAVVKAIDLFRVRRTVDVKKEVPELEAPTLAEQPPEKDLSPSGCRTNDVESLQIRLQGVQQELSATSRQYDRLFEEQRLQLQQKAEEIDRLTSALNDLWGVAVAQLEALRRADEDRAEKDKHVAQLLLILARHQGLRADEDMLLTLQHPAAHIGDRAFSAFRDESMYRASHDLLAA